MPSQRSPTQLSDQEGIKPEGAQGGRYVITLAASLPQAAIYTPRHLGLCGVVVCAYMHACVCVWCVVVVVMAGIEPRVLYLTLPSLTLNPLQ